MTVTGPDLTFGRHAIEQTMTAVCRITRDPQDRRDDTLDPVTGALIPPDPDVSTLYSDGTIATTGRVLDGRCLVSGVAEETEEEGTRVQGGEYKALIPWDAPDIPVGAQLEVVSCPDQTLVGRVLRVVASRGSSLAVVRRLNLQLVQGPS